LLWIGTCIGRAASEGLDLYLPGEYAGTIKSFAPDGQALASVEAVVIIRRILNGHFLEFDGSTKESAPRRNKALLSFDSASQRYTYWAFDDRGGTSSFTEQYDPVARTLSGSGTLAGMSFVAKTTFSEDRKEVVTSYEWRGPSAAVLRVDVGRFGLVKPQPGAPGTDAQPRSLRKASE